MRDALGFSVTPHMRRVMDVDGCHASIMKADKRKKDGDEGLPEGLPIPVLPVDYLKHRPDNWIGGEGSYVVPVDSEWGLWFNFMMNDYETTAVLISVKGMNPITGERMDGYKLKNIEDKCPVHDVGFKHGKFCPECNFKWPAQNFLTKPPYLDGYRQPDGTVRQFYFTEDMAKSIPELVIGKEDTVPAFGFCFYKTKETPKYAEGERLKEKFSGIKSNSTVFLSASPGIYGLMGRYAKSDKTYPRDPLVLYRDTSSHVKSMRSMSLSHSADAEPIASTDMTFSASSERCMYVDSSSVGEIHTDSLINASPISVPPIERGEVGIGAGASIEQKIHVDQRDLSVWKEKPTGIIRLYFVFQEEFERYASAGFNDLEGSKSGYLEGLPVGGAK